MLLQVQVDANWALFGATVILVIVTLFYAKQTYNLVNVTFRPALLATLAHRTTGTKSNVDIVIENIGLGTAVAIDCNYSIAQLDRTINITLLRPHTSSRFELDLFLWNKISCSCPRAILKCHLISIDFFDC
jgi:hypothetical protein